MQGNLITVVVLDHIAVPWYGSYLPGDVAGFEKSVAEALIAQRRVRRLQEEHSTTPAPSSNAVQAKPVVARANRAPVPDAPPPATPSPRAYNAGAQTDLERIAFGRWRTAPPWNRKVPASLSPRLAAAMAFLREVLRTPKPATEVVTLARQCGISLATLRRAKRALGTVKVQKAGMRAGWVWVMRDGTLWG